MLLLLLLLLLSCPEKHQLLLFFSAPKKLLRSTGFDRHIQNGPQQWGCPIVEIQMLRGWFCLAVTWQQNKRTNWDISLSFEFVSSWHGGILVSFPLKKKWILGFVMQMLVWTPLAKLDGSSQANHCATSGISLVTGKSTAGSTAPFATNFQRAKCHYQGQQTWICFPPSKKIGVPPKL